MLPHYLETDMQNLPLALLPKKRQCRFHQIKIPYSTTTSDAVLWTTLLLQLPIFARARSALIATALAATTANGTRNAQSVRGSQWSLRLPQLYTSHAS